MNILIIKNIYIIFIYCYLIYNLHYILNIFFFYFGLTLIVIYSFCLNNYSGFIILCISERNFILYYNKFFIDFLLLEVHYFYN